MSSGVRTLKVQINLLCPVLLRCFSAQTMLPCRVSPAQGLDLALPCAHVLQSIPFLQPLQLPLNISLPSPAFQIYPPAGIHAVNFLWVHLQPVIQADDGDFTQNWCQIHLWELPPVLSHQFVPLITTSEVPRQFPSILSSTCQVHISPNVGNPAKDPTEGKRTHCSPPVSTPLISLLRK